MARPQTIITKEHLDSLKARQDEFRATNHPDTKIAESDYQKARNSFNKQQKDVVKPAMQEGVVKNTTPSLAFSKAPVDNTDWVAPSISHHDELSSMADNIENSAISLAKQGHNTDTVMDHVYSASDALANHLHYHQKRDGAPQAAGWLKKAAGHIGDAAKALDSAKPQDGNPQGEATARLAKAKADNYNLELADGKAANRLEEPPREDIGTFVNPYHGKVRDQSKEGRAAENERQATKDAAKAEKEAARNPSRQELERRRVAGEAVIKRSLDSLPDTPRDSNFIATPTSPKDRAKLRDQAFKKSQAEKKAAAAANAPRPVSTAPTQDRDGYTQEQHDAAFDAAHAHWFRDSKRKKAGSDAYRKSEAFTKPAKYMAAVSTRATKRSAKSGSPKAGPVTITQGPIGAPSTRAVHLDAFNSGRGA